MNKNLLLSRANIRKTKGQTAAIAVLVLLASLMMNLWLMLGTDYKKNFDRCHDKLNDGHVTILAYNSGEEFPEFVEKLLKDRSDVIGYCVTKAFGWSGSFEYNDGEINTPLVFINKETALSRAVGKIEITEDSKFTSGLYLPMLYGTSYSAGDEIELNVGGDKLKYTVCGFFNSMSAGSHNCAICAMVLTEDKFKELSESGTLPKATLISVRLTDKLNGETVDTELKDTIQSEFPGMIIISNSYALITSSRYISQSICAAILSAMAFLITLIAVVVISSNVMNYIHEEMKNLGALKAIGYKSGQLISALITQFTAIAFITAAVGIALSYAVFPALNDMMAAQTGIPYEVRFLPVPCAATIAFMVGVIAAAVFLSAKRIRKIEPITALRQGIQTHDFSKNHIPLDKTKAPLNFALALKNVCFDLKRNVTVSVTMLVLSLVIVFSGVMLNNFVADEQNFIDMVVGETADSSIDIAPSAEEEFNSALENDSRVLNHYLFTTQYVTHVGGVSLMANICNDCSKMNNQNVVVEGRFPKFDNEIAIAIKYARDKKLKLGEEISISAGTNEEKYIISGFTQLTNNFGKDCLMTRGGYERIAELTDCNYFAVLTDGTDIDKFNEEIAELFPNEVNSTVNFAAFMEGASRVYISLVDIIVKATLVLSAVIVVFVIYLLVRTMLNSKKRDYGILKALGFTTRQLVLQTALSFMPPIIISTVLGTVLSTFVINPLLALFLGGIGIVKCMFAVPLYFNIIAGAGLILFAFAATCLMSLRVKKITPRTLLSGE